jgi:hypothetical protein
MAQDLVLDVNPLDGSVIYFSAPETGGYQFRTEVDVEPLVERNKAMQNAVDHSARTFSDGRLQYHVASITPKEHRELVEAGILTRGFAILDEAKFSKWLNDSEFKYLRKLTSKRI